MWETGSGKIIKSQQRIEMKEETNWLWFRLYSSQHQQISTKYLIYTPHAFGTTSSIYIYKIGGTKRGGGGLLQRLKNPKKYL